MSRFENALRKDTDEVESGDAEQVRYEQKLHAEADAQRAQPAGNASTADTNKMFTSMASQSRTMTSG